jgi:hypothetical protein
MIDRNTIDKAVAAAGMEGWDHIEERMRDALVAVGYFAPPQHVDMRNAALQEAEAIVADYVGKQSPIAAAIRALMSSPSPQAHLVGRWLPIAEADKTIVHQQHFSSINLTIRNSDRYWVRDADGRTYEASWSEGENGRDYWWDWDNESPVDPVEFMPHPLDPRHAEGESQ